MKKVILTISLIMVVLSLIYVYEISNPKTINKVSKVENYTSVTVENYTIVTYPLGRDTKTESRDSGNYPPKPSPPDLGIRIYPALKEGSYFLSFKEKSVTLNLTIVFEFVKGFNETVKIRVLKYGLDPDFFPFGWNGTHFVFGELEKQCKVRYARPVNYEVFFDKTEFYVGPNLNTELHVTLKIYETPIDPKIKTLADICPECNPNYVFVNESNFGPYFFGITFDDYGYWNKYPEKGTGLILVSYFLMQINLGGYIELTKELYNELYMQHKEIMDQLNDYRLNYCRI
jgi:hypothetical protein